MLTPPTINWRPSLYYRLWTNQMLQEILFANFASFMVKIILLSLVEIFGITQMHPVASGVCRTNLKSFTFHLPWRCLRMICSAWFPETELRTSLRVMVETFEREMFSASFTSFWTASCKGREQCTFEQPHLMLIETCIRECLLLDIKKQQ